MVVLESVDLTSWNIKMTFYEAVSSYYISIGKLSIIPKVLVQSSRDQSLKDWKDPSKSGRSTSMMTGGLVTDTEP